VLRRELRPEGIAVTYVDPGAVDTAFMSRAGLPGAPVSLLATPEDVARKILIAVGTRPPCSTRPWQTASSRSPRRSRDHRDAARRQSRADRHAGRCAG